MVQVYVLDLLTLLLRMLIILRSFVFFLNTIFTLSFNLFICILLFLCVSLSVTVSAIGTIRMELSVSSEGVQPHLSLIMAWLEQRERRTVDTHVLYVVIQTHTHSSLPTLWCSAYVYSSTDV